MEVGIPINASIPMIDTMNTEMHWYMVVLYRNDRNEIAALAIIPNPPPRAGLTAMKTRWETMGAALKA